MLAMSILATSLAKIAQNRSYRLPNIEQTTQGTHHKELRESLTNN